MLPLSRDTAIKRTRIRDDPDFGTIKQGLKHNIIYNHQKAKQQKCLPTDKLIMGLMQRKLFSKKGKTFLLYAVIWVNTQCTFKISQTVT